MHRVQVIRVVLCVVIFAAFVDATVEDTRLPLTCKNIARDVIMYSCKGSRIKRATEEVDTEKVKEEVKIAPRPDDETKKMQQPRQWMDGGFMDGGFGGYENVMQNSYHNVDLQLPGVSFNDDRGTQVEEQYGPTYPSLPYGPFGMMRSSGGSAETVVSVASLSPIPYNPSTKIVIIRSPDSKDYLGYDLSSEELEELHKEIGGRMPRNSKDMNKKIFLSVAAKCCPNVKLCYENPSMIPCMGF